MITFTSARLHGSLIRIFGHSEPQWEAVTGAVSGQIGFQEGVRIDGGAQVS